MSSALPSTPPRQRLPPGLDWLRFGLIFVLSFGILFLLSNRMVGVFDESFPLVDAMRVLAGQVPHRDFYTPYGPAQYYVLAGLFKLTYPSLLISRLLDLTYKAAILATVGHLLSRFCRKILVYAGVVVAGLLILAADSNGSVLAPIALCVLWSTYLLNGLLANPASRWGAYGTGLLAGFVVLLRYDIGLALVLLHGLLLVVAMVLGRKNHGSWKVHPLALYICGAATVVLPLASLYASAGAIPGFLFELVAYPAKYYRAGRGLPFPHPALHEPLNVIVYMPFVIVSVAALVLVILYLRGPGDKSGFIPDSRATVGRTCAVFVCLTTVMALKGVVRIGIVHSSLGLLSGIVALCLLAECVFNRPGWMRAAVGFVCVFMGAITAFCAMREVRSLKRQQTMMLQHFGGPHSAAEQAWCAERNPLTRGVCYLADGDHAQTIRYIDQHTTARDLIYVGLPTHDRVFASDNLTYFAAQRLPATHWSMFDPDLQNTGLIQRQMIGELELARPPVIVLDSEFLEIIEPNDSGRSSGVHLLDEYLAAHYRAVQTFGKMQIEQRE